MRVSVNSGLIAMIKNVLRRDADEGKMARKEMLEELEQDAVGHLQPTAPVMRSAFRTTQSVEGHYRMVFEFPSMETMHAADDEWRTLVLAMGTPSSHWRATGDKDPHAGMYDFERASLTMGKLTDDELANGMFMNYDQPLNVAGVLAGTHSSAIAWMTAGKDRIRWLSRKLAKTEAHIAAMNEQIEVSRMALISAAVETIRATIVVEGETPEHLREAIAMRVADVSKPTFVIGGGPLTQKEINDIWNDQYKKYGQMCDSSDWDMFARSIEQATLRKLTTLGLISETTGNEQG